MWWNRPGPTFKDYYFMYIPWLVKCTLWNYPFHRWQKNLRMDTDLKCKVKIVIPKILRISLYSLVCWWVANVMVTTDTQHGDGRVQRFKYFLKVCFLTRSKNKGNQVNTTIMTKNARSWQYLLELNCSVYLGNKDSKLWLPKIPRSQSSGGPCGGRVYAGTW